MADSIKGLEDDLDKEYADLLDSAIKKIVENLTLLQAYISSIDLRVAKLEKSMKWVEEKEKVLSGEA